MKLRDIGYSLAREIGSDSAGSAVDHLATLGRIALGEFIRFGRGVPRGLFEIANLRFPPRMIDVHQGEGKPVIIVPIGEVSSRTVDVVARVVTEIYGLPVQVLRSRAMWPQVYDPGTQTADAGKILTVLRPMLKSGRVIAITDVSLKADAIGFDGNRTYGPVYGYAGIGWPVSVVSTHGIGLGDDTPQTWARVVRLVVHELAHGFGAQHHEKDGVACVMNVLPAGEGKLGLDRMTHELCTRCLGVVMFDRKKDPPEDKIESCFSR